MSMVIEELPNSDKVCIWDNLRTLVIHLTNRCNLRCKYCFERHGQMEDIPEKTMFQIIDRAMDSIYFQGLMEEVKTKSKTKKQNFISISFFGGEPLLRFDLIKSAVEYIAKNKPPNITASFGVTTNGTLLTEENIDFMSKNNFSMIFSIDGPENIHNVNRVYEGDIGSYSQTIKNLPYLLDKMGKRVTARPSYTDKVAPYLFDIVKHMVDDLKFTTVAAIPVIDATQFGERINWEAVWPKLTEQYWEITNWWYKESIQKGRYIDIKFIRDFGRDFLGRHTPIQGNACGTGFGYQAYGPNGNIYPCHRYVNDIDHEKMIMCKFDEETISKDSAKALFIKREEFTSELGCETCMLEDICSKGCNVVNVKLTGSRKIVPKEQCWFTYLQFRNGMRLLSRYGRDPRLIQRLGGHLKNIAQAGTTNSPTAVSQVKK